MPSIVVVAIVNDRRLQLGTYTDPIVAEAVGWSWAKQAFCRGVVITAGANPPLVLIKPAVSPSMVPTTS